MTTLIAIDPGSCTGYAVFYEGHLSLVGTTTTYSVPKLVVDIAVIEFPKFYPQGHPRPNDLLTLAAVAGRYQERYQGAAIQLVYPRDWKGTIDGDIMCKRIEAAMTDSEKALLPKEAESRRHNAIDAVGLGKWALKQPWYRAFRH